MAITIIVVALTCLALHSYLNSFWVRGILPYSAGFLMFVKFELLLVLINSIRIFGWLVGIIVGLLFCIAGGYLLFPIVFLLHCITKKPSKTEALLGAKEQPNPVFYGGWSFLLLGLAILTVIGFFIESFPTTKCTVLTQSALLVSR